MLKKIVFFAALLMITLSNCEKIAGPKNELSANVKIVKWEQDGSSYSSWGWVRIYYEIENTGDLEINCYTINFQIKCKQLYTYENEYVYYMCSADGGHIKVGHKANDYINVPTFTKTATVDIGIHAALSVEILNYELNPTN